MAGEISANTTWKQAARVILAALESGTPKGKELARAELFRMADVADFAQDLQAELRRQAN
ncbi:hypothetical protein vB_RpoS-V16_09 [Ruegeria phage vB_RpoS-V16]|uniref:hypothetical protein n=1 Tax=Ruegeria phage vB_RpoS-V16 TaxID=2218618 RepID=UPI000DCACCB6|nr:hypothetical protein JT311_gp09 [Ruegeria phage vB_RpoS-V16]AWY09445.1 hypothetical protein vB_RpoS-V16_09 [Ruegeria phage vB_RpoS-V16]